ncbi:MAG: ATP synthase F1 subunit epsilon [Cryomorphaceae bacterium]|nr:ATP synthase F1 subunit epsilon [Cryomorphaceae bacterium]
MQVDIISPEKLLFSGEATSIKMPGVNGAFQVLENHAPMISTLTAGVVEMELIQKNERKTFDINGGVVEIRNNKVSLLAD